MASPNRLRVVLTDSDTDRPASTRVIFRQRVGWFAVLGAFLALLCVPLYRNAFEDQLRAVLTQKMPAWLGSGFFLSENAHKDQERRLRAATAPQPGNARPALGAMLVGLVPAPTQPEPAGARNAATYDPTASVDARVDYMAALHQQYPQDPVVLAQLLRYASQRGIRIERSDLPKERGGSDHTRLLAPAALPRFEEWAAAGERLDPGNGYFASMLAGAYVAAGRDEDGMRAMQRASEAAAWQDYAYLEGLAARDAWIRACGDRGVWMHLGPSAGVLLPHLAMMRQTARVLLWRAEQLGLRGDAAGEHRRRAALIRFGSRMRRGGDTTVARLVGGAIEDLGFKGGVMKTDRVPRSEEEIERRRREVRAEYVARVRREAPEWVGLLEEESEALPRFRTAVRSYMGVEPLDPLMKEAVNRDGAGYFLLANLIGCGLAWLLSAAAVLGFEQLAARRGDDREAAAGLPAPARVITTFAALAAMALALRTVALASDGSAWPALVVSGAMLALTLLFVSRRRGEQPEWSAAQGVAVAAGALVVTAVLLMPWDLKNPAFTFWTRFSPGTILSGTWEDAQAQATPDWLWLLGPVPLVLGLVNAAFSAALIRRASVSGLAQAMRTGGRLLTGALAGAYLVYLLFAAPLNIRDGRAVDRAFMNEIQGRAF